jgi:hypothetical protein
LGTVAWSYLERHATGFDDRVVCATLCIYDPVLSAVADGFTTNPQTEIVKVSQRYMFTD